MPRPQSSRLFTISVFLLLQVPAPTQINLALIEPINYWTEILSSVTGTLTRKVDAIGLAKRFVCRSKREKTNQEYGFRILNAVSEIQ